MVLNNADTPFSSSEILEATDQMRFVDEKPDLCEKLQEPAP